MDDQCKVHRIGWEELQASFSWLSRVPQALSQSFRWKTDRRIDPLENRQWWLAEFALVLPRA